ncbi:MAG: transcription elongation factor GreA [Clostridia bacterium]|nr:transcription elongation factor GreA [Clostridia bacterium]
MAEEVKILTVTEEGLKKLQAELDYLINVKRPEVTKNIGIARGFGDLSENSEYDEAKNEQAKVEAQIAELEQTLEHVKVVSNVGADVVNIGTKVRIKNLDMDKELVYTLVGSNEANALEGKISDQSPVGKAIIGAKVGDILTITIPSGALRIQILSIEK